MTRCHPCSYVPSFETLKNWGGLLIEVIKKIAYSVLQTLSELFSFRFQVLAWNMRHQGHLKVLPAFIFRSPPNYSSHLFVGEDFRKLADAYKKQLSLDERGFERHINQKLKKGYCYGQALRLIERVKENKTSLAHEIQLLAASDSRITKFQIFEEFREAFQGTEFESQVNAVLPSFESTLFLSHGQEGAKFKASLVGKTGLVLLRLSSNKLGHSLVLELDPDHSVFGFYNSNCSGYYEYSDFESYYNVLSSHIQTHVDFATYSGLYFYSK